ncbi:MAG: hypothetical protein KBT46_06290 [Ruminococcus sp.]|nr:hypothetical protein [Candidatus Copronaster equi]
MTKETVKRSWRIIKRKKWPIILAVLIIVSLILAPILYSVNQNRVRFSAKNPISLNDYYVKKTDRDKINLIADKGFSCQAPENTIPAIKKAEEYGFTQIKIDVRLTQDGVWVLCDDSKVNNMTDKNGSVSSYTYYDLITLNINNGAKHKEYSNLKIPTLEQALKACLDCNISPLINIKDYDDDGIKKLLELIDVNGFSKSCSISSSDKKLLETIHKKNNKIKLYSLIKKLDNDEINYAINNPETGLLIDIRKDNVSSKKLKKIVGNKNPIICYIPNDKKIIDKVFKTGVTDYLTDRIYEKK